MRFLVNAAIALSTLLAPATAGLWVRSYWVCDQVWTGNYLITSELGGLYLSPYRSPIARDPRHRDSYPAGSLGVMEREWGDHPHRLRPLRMVRRPGATVPWLLIVPHWFTALAFAALPGYRLARRVRRRQPPGHCPACGYDLRATPDRCPECGRTP